MVLGVSGSNMLICHKVFSMVLELSGSNMLIFHRFLNGLEGVGIENVGFP